MQIGSRAFISITKVSAAVLALAVMATTPTPGAAATPEAQFVVTKTADTNDGVCDADCSLREAVQAAGANAQPDLITFEISSSDAGCDGTACTITFTSQIEPAADGGNLTTISGAGANVITLNGNNATRLFGLFSAVRVAMDNLTIRGGNGISTQGIGGGAIYLNGSLNGPMIRNQLTLTDVTLDGNHSDSGPGGAINSNVSSELILKNVTLSNNTSGNQGSAVALLRPATMTNVTISGNSTPGQGGAIFVGAAPAALTATSLTVTNNTAGFFAGGINNLNGGTVTIRNSIVAGNSSDDVSGPFVSQGYNFIGKKGNSNFVVGDPNPNNDFVGIEGAPLDPRLLALADNGGSTLTHALSNTSRALDKGSSFGNVTDQRGVTRPVDFPGLINAPGGDGADIGAYEFNGDLPARAVPFDYDGDSKTDLSVYRSAGDQWSILQSSDGSLREVIVGSGCSCHQIAPADFDGDGKTDLAIFAGPTMGNWTVLRSSTMTVTITPWGTAGDLPAPGDFDGDGRADLGIFRPASGQWWVNLSGGGSINGYLFGQAGDLPLVGNFDDDNKDDIAIYRADGQIPGAPDTSAWLWVRSSDQQTFGVGFGRPTDRMAQGDYDGDGSMDIAIMRPTGNESGVPTWYILKSSSDYGPAGVYYEVWGVPTDLPVPGDYDGDGKVDVAIWRESTGEWWILKSTGGFTNPILGQTGDVPTPRAFLGD